MKFFAALFLSSIAFCQYLGAVDVVSVGNFKFLGGQYIFKSDPSSLSGNINLTVSPALKYSDKFSLIPSYYGAYKGTKEVSDLAGGGTLFQDGLTNLVSIKGVYSANRNLKLKLGTGYRTEFLRETKDEGWGAGLFDYKKLNTGIEAEYKYSKSNSVRLGADYFSINFPNYKSLESKQQSSTSTLSRELTGAKTLDSANVMIYLGNQSFINKFIVDFSIISTAQNYPDQPLVIASGDLSSTKRSDALLQASFSLSYLVNLGSRIKLVPSLGYGMITNNSSQNHYDAKKLYYIADYYDYAQSYIVPGLQFYFGSKKWLAAVSYSTGRQQYSARPTQDTAGTYLTDNIYIDEAITSLSIVYPMNRNFKLQTLANIVKSSSNMKYEKTYSYNYDSSNYMLGIIYEY